jgi:hypothetical protein
MLRFEEVEADVPLLEGEDVELVTLGELPLFVAVRCWLCILPGTDAVVARVDASDGTDPAVFVGDEPPGN